MEVFASSDLSIGANRLQMLKTSLMAGKTRGQTKLLMPSSREMAYPPHRS